MNLRLITRSVIRRGGVAVTLRVTSRSGEINTNGGKSLHQVQLAMAALRWSVACRADAVDLQAVAAFIEAVLAANLVNDDGDRFVGELDQLSALRADQVIVLRIAIVVLVDFAAGGARDLAEQAGFFQKSQGAIDRRTADAAATLVRGDARDQCVGVKVFVLREDLFDDDGPLAREPLLFVTRNSRNLSIGDCSLTLTLPGQFRVGRTSSSARLRASRRSRKRRR